MLSEVVMESMMDKLLNMIKPLIQEGKLKELQTLWRVYSDDKYIKKTIVFQKAILYAANRNQYEIFDWIESLHDKLSPAEKNEVHKVYAYACFVRQNTIKEDIDE